MFCYPVLHELSYLTTFMHDMLRVKISVVLWNPFHQNNGQKILHLKETLKKINNKYHKSETYSWKCTKEAPIYFSNIFTFFRPGLLYPIRVLKYWQFLGFLHRSKFIFGCKMVNIPLNCQKIWTLASTLSIGGIISQVERECKTIWKINWGLL